MASLAAHASSPVGRTGGSFLAPALIRRAVGDYRPPRLDRRPELAPEVAA